MESAVVSAMGKTTNALRPCGSPSSTRRMWSPWCPLWWRPIAAPSSRSVGPTCWIPMSRRSGCCRSILEGASCSDEGYDAIVGQGERGPPALLAPISPHRLACGCRPGEIPTDGDAPRGRVDVTGVGLKVNEEADSGRRADSRDAGFVGSAPDGRPTTLGREGSDFSGRLLAEALGADRFIVWKDVPGVMTGDPRVWPPATCLPAWIHGTADILGKAGAGILHRDTMAPIRRAGIPLHVRSFLDPSAPGTRIEGDTPPAGLPPCGRCPWRGMA